MERSPREVSGNLAEVPGRGQPIGRHNDSVSHDVLPSIAPLHCDLAPSILLRFAHACPLCLPHNSALLLGISSCIYQMVAACSAPNDTKLRHFGTGIIRHFPWPLFLYGSLYALPRLTLLWFTAPLLHPREWCCDSSDSCDSCPSYRHERAR